MKQSLYFVRDAEHPCFKIGIARNVFRRSKELYTKVDLERSFLIKCEDVGAVNANRAEKTLHLLFKRYNVRRENGIGCTEWFSLECWDQVIRFLADHKKEWGISDPLPIPQEKIGQANSREPSRKPAYRYHIDLYFTADDYERLRLAARLNGDIKSSDYLIHALRKQLDADLTAYEAGQESAA